jgi:hypothetical protein
MPHGFADRVLTISREPVDAGAYEEVGGKIICGAKQLVDVTFPVTDVNAANRIVEKFSRLAHILQPAPAFLFLNRYARGIDMTLELRSPLELLPCPEFHCSQAKWQSIGSDSKARMHQDAALRERLSRAPAVFPRAQGRLARVADEFGTLALVRECGRVLQDKHWPIGGLHTLGASLEMSAQDIVFADTVIGQKPVRSLGRSPVLTGERDRLPHAVPQLLEQACKAAAQPGVLEFASLDFQIQPRMIIRVSLAGHPACVWNVTYARLI